MLELFARHGRFDLVLTCHGDVQVDYHHTTEDVGIALGQAFARALGEMRGICRYGSFYLPMDEALVLCAVDLSGRCTLNWDIRCQTEKVGDFDVECAKEFWYGFARSVPATVHFVQFAGENTHHILEACFMIMNKKKIDYRFKILYAVAILMVVAGHCDGGGISLDFAQWFPYEGIHLALFTFCSGYFFKMQH